MLHGCARSCWRFPNHRTVDHSVGEYVWDQVHTNGKDLLGYTEMWIGGTFHHINSKHLHRYVNEFAGCHSLGPQDTERMVRELYAALIR